MTIAPRRYSINDPAYDAAMGDRVRVTVDGDMMRCVVAYDCDEGWLDAVAHDEFGVMVSYQGEIVTRRYHGKIKAVLHD